MMNVLLLLDFGGLLEHWCSTQPAASYQAWQVYVYSIPLFQLVHLKRTCTHGISACYALVSKSKNVGYEIIGARTMAVWGGLHGTVLTAVQSCHTQLWLDSHITDIKSTSTSLL
eukprot:scpid38396/ scgid30646/ 